MRIAIGADHAGFELKEVVKQALDELRTPYKDFGTESDDSVDYPDYAARVANAVADGMMAAVSSAIIGACHTPLR